MIQTHLEMDTALPAAAMLLSSPLSLHAEKAATETLVILKSALKRDLIQVWRNEKQNILLN